MGAAREESLLDVILLDDAFHVFRLLGKDMKPMQYDLSMPLQR